MSQFLHDKGKRLDQCLADPALEALRKSPWCEALPNRERLGAFIHFHCDGDTTALDVSQSLTRIFHGRNYILPTIIPSSRILFTAPTLKEPRVMTGSE